MDRTRFSGRQLTVMVVAVCAAIMLAPVGVMAATGSGVNIIDPVTSANKARVSGNGTLLIAPRDVHTGATAAIDGSSLRVGGTVNVGNLPSSQVVTSGDSTVRLGGASGVLVTAGNQAFSSSINTSGYASVRVAVYCNGCTSASEFAVITTGAESYLLGHQNLEDFGSLNLTGSLSFDTPGTSLAVVLRNRESGGVLFWYDVYGRP